MLLSTLSEACGSHFRGTGVSLSSSPFPCTRFYSKDGADEAMPAQCFEGGGYAALSATGRRVFFFRDCLVCGWRRPSCRRRGHDLPLRRGSRFRRGFPVRRPETLREAIAERIGRENQQG